MKKLFAPALCILVLAATWSVPVGASAQQGTAARAERAAERAERAAAGAERDAARARRMAVRAAR